MDVPRKDANRRKWIRRIVPAAILLTVVPTITVMLGKLKPAAPLVEAASVWPDTVKRGPMVVNVRGLGTLVAEDILYVAATTDGRVAGINIRPGADVVPETVILTLTNPELQQATLDAEYSVKMSEAGIRDLKVQLESQTLTMKAEVARIETDYMQAKLRLDRDEQLFKEGLIIKLNYQLVKSNSDDLGKRLDIEKERLRIREEAVAAQIALKMAEIDKLKALHQLKLSQVDALKVRAGVAGVLQELPGATPGTTLQVGQRVAAGTALAKIAQPTRLKAELKIPETQITEVKLNQVAQVDTRNGIIAGRVSRIDPAAKEGTVLVDVRLEGKLPPSARPDLSVDGFIETARLDDVLYVGRPAFGQPNSTVSMFKYEPDGKGAHRVQVEFGRTAVNTIEIKRGLNVGDKVILSDMSNWDAHDRVRLN
ncbi:MAG: HlyD family efflux transporter periplasmic adaptor subunit [Bryobacteraceae bacterium]